MQFVKLHRKKKKIEHTHNFEESKGEWTERSDKSDAAPLQELAESLQALSHAVCFVMELDKSLHGQIIPHKVSVIRTKEAGTRSMQIGYTRMFSELGTDKTYSTPFFRIDKPDSGESGKVILEEEHLAAVAKFIDHAEGYIKGKRQQMTLEEWTSSNSGVKEGVDADEAQPSLIGED